MPSMLLEAAVAEVPTAEFQAVADFSRPRLFDRLRRLRRAA